MENCGLATRATPILKHVASCSLYLVPMSHSVWRETPIAGSGTFRDLRFGLRMLHRNPGFTLVAILTLAFAIGGNVAIFSVTSALLLRPFPYAQPQQLVSIGLRDAQGNASTGNNTLIRYEFLRDHARALTMAAWTSDDLDLTGAGEPAQLPIARVTPNFFSLLGVSPALGRTFNDAEGQPESHPVVVLSNALWRARFHSDPAVVGSSIDLDGIPSTVIGVMPAGLAFPFIGKAELFTPRYFEYSLFSAARIRQGVGYLGYLARLHPDSTLALANSELNVLNAQYVRLNPEIHDAVPGTVMTASPLRDMIVADLRIKLWMLSAAVFVLLLIACANVTSLLLSRAMARRRELAVRAALGASRGAMIRQLLTESILLAAAAGIIGIALGYAAERALAAWGATQLPTGIAITLDARVLLFAVAISFLTGVLTGLFPALQLARTDLNSTLRDEGRGLTGGRSRTRLRSLLVVGQVSLSLLLLIGAGLLLRSFTRLLHTDPGFAPDHILTMEVSLPTEKYAKPQQQTAFFDEVLRRVSALPGVKSAAISAALPLETRRVTPLLPEGQPEVPLMQRPFTDIEAISPQWFDTLHVPLLAGRPFSTADQLDAPKVVIVNQSFANRYWPNQSPIGKHIVIGRGPDPSQVIGVAQDVHNLGIAENPQPQVWLPFAQLPWGDMNLLIRTAVPPMSIAAAVRAQIAAIDPDQPITGIQTADDLISAGHAESRFITALLAAFSIMALALAAIGLAAMLAWTVVQRRQEMAIRLALGAEQRDILWLVVRQGLLLAVSGIVIGTAAGLLLTRLMTSLLYKTSARDLGTFALAPLIFLLIAWLASYLPARRATRVDPMDTLRAG
jgi:putative ABC transport system permease protein